jgi:triphosphatase
MWMMADHLEVELKLVVTAEGAEALAAADWVRAATPAAVPLAATYFDTADRALLKAGYSLRVRTEGARVVQTVKASGQSAGLFARPEWECEVAGSEPRLDAGAGPLGTLLPEAVQAALAPAFTVAVQRTQARIARDAAAVTFALDRGSVTAGEAREEVCEVELELDAGPPALLFTLAREVDRVAPVRLGVLSKSERGYRLAAGAAARAVKAETVALSPDMSAADALAVIARSCLRQFLLNQEVLAERDDPAALHQARVGLRRLRSAFSLFRPLFAGDVAANELREGLRTLQGVLGEARDIDVLVQRLGPDHPQAARLQLGRMEAYEAVDAALAAAPMRTLMLDLAEWLALGKWRESEPAQRPVVELAALILDKHRRRIRKRGRDLSTLDDHDRHQVRIEAKKLRYAAEFFAALYPGRKAARRHDKFLKAITALQERLGTLNDLATAPKLFALLGIEQEAQAVDRSALLSAAEEAWDGLVEAKRFWR